MSERLEFLATQHYELHAREDHAIKFCADNETLQQMIESFGSIDASYAHYSTTTVEGRGLKEASLDQPAYFTVVTRSVTVHPPRLNSSFQGCAVLLVVRACVRDAVCSFRSCSRPVKLEGRAVLEPVYVLSITCIQLASHAVVFRGLVLGRR